MNLQKAHATAVIHPRRPASSVTAKGLIPDRQRLCGWIVSAVGHLDDGHDLDRKDDRDGHERRSGRELWIFVIPTHLTLYQRP
jgi:hypothetical protein